MTNRLIEKKIDVTEWLEPLRHLQSLGQTLHASTDLPGDLRAESTTKIAELLAALPPELLALVRGRVRTGQRLVAPVRNGQCSACYTRIPLGDCPTVMSGRGVVACQYCHVVLHLDEPDRGYLREGRE